MLTGLLFSRAFCQPSKKSQLEHWHPWRAPIGQWGPPGFIPTEYVAHWCVIGHCVAIMATHGVSQTGFFCYLPPHLVLPHCTPLPIPPSPSIINTDGRKRQQKYHEIQPSGIKKISYNKNQ